jgi:hypothetical protein
LLLFGCRYPDDIQNAVFLDKADDPYIMEIYAPDFEYTIKSDVPGDDALQQAEEFLRCSFHYEQAQLSRIFDPQGNVIGYEMKPLYSVVRFGMQDVMNIEYRVRKTRQLFTKLDPRVEAIINDQGRPGQKRGQQWLAGRGGEKTSPLGHTCAAISRRAA